MLSLFLFIFSMIYASEGFLLDSTTRLPGTGNSALSDRHYIQLMDSLFEEKKARQNLEAIVSDLMKTVQITSPFPTVSQTYVTRLNKQDAKIDHLEQKYATVLQELVLVKGENKNLTHQLDNLKTHMGTATLNIVQKEINETLQTQIAQLSHNSVQDSEMKREINELKATNQARSNDFIALHTMVTTTSQKLDNVSSLLESNIKNVTAIEGNVIQIGAKQSQLSSQLQQTQQTISNNSNKVTTLDSCVTQIKSKQSQISGQLEQTQQTLSKNSRKVMIRACDAKADLPSSSIYRFTSIKESYGVTKTASFITSGKFTCEDAGLYILMIVVFTDAKGGNVYLIKNSNVIQQLETKIPNNDAWYHTIPGSLALHLSVGDTVHVQHRGVTLGEPHFTCLSIIKIH